MPREVVIGAQMPFRRGPVTSVEPRPHGGPAPSRRGSRPDSGWQSRRDAGFTLLEILVTLVVLGLLLATLADGMRFGLQAWGVEGRTARQASGLARTDRVLRQLVGAVVPGDADDPENAVTGTAHTLSFTTTLPAGIGALGTDQARVTLAARGGRLLLLWRPQYRRWAGVVPAGTAETLLDQVARLDLRFWQPAVAGGGQWVTAWSGSAAPSLVRVHIVFAAGGSKGWPDIIVASGLGSGAR